MNTENKNAIAAAKMRSLMERMENHETYNQAMLNEEQMINEAVTGARRQVTRDEIFDILNIQDETGNFKYVSVTYVKALPIYTGKRNWRTDDVTNALDNYKGDKNAQWYKDITAYNNPSVKGTGRKPEDKNPLMTMIATQRYYNMQWLSHKAYAKRYADYKTSLENLRVGLAKCNPVTMGAQGDNHNQRYFDDYGNQYNQTGKLSRDFDTNHAKVSCKNYLVKDGQIVDEIDGSLTNAMQGLPKKTWDWSNGTPDEKQWNWDKEPYQNLINEPELLKSYSDQRAELDKTFKPKNFVFDQILCICATCDGVPYYYINDSITTIPRTGDKPSIDIDPKALVKIAEDQLGQSFEEISSEKFAK